MDKGQYIKSGLFQVPGWHSGLHNDTPPPQARSHIKCYERYLTEEKASRDGKLVLYHSCEVYIKRATIRDRDRKRNHVATKVETRAMYTRVNECWRTPEGERGQEWILPYSLGKCGPEDTFTSNFCRRKFSAAFSYPSVATLYSGLETHALASGSCTGFPTGLSSCDRTGNAASDEHKQHLC